MREYQTVMLQSLRAEIAFFNGQILIILMVITVLIVALYVLAHVDRFRPCARLIPIVIVSGLFGLGRADLLMHRAGAYLASTEQAADASKEWQAFKAEHIATTLLPVYDFLGLALWLYLFFWAEAAAWRMANTDRERWVYAGATGILAVLAGASIVFGATSGG